MKNLNPKFKFIAVVLIMTLSQVMTSQISITAVPYTPATTDFNTFNPSNASNALATIPAGWSFSSTGTAAYNGQSISGPATGGYWAYTYLLSGDYNLGAQRDANAGDITYHVDYVNNTGGLITSLTLAWDYEQWRFANSSGWSCFGTGALAGNTTLPTKNYIGSSSSFLNAATSTSIPTFTLSGLSIADGATFGISWVTNDDTGADNGVAIDNFSISANATPSIVISNPVITAANIYQTSTNNVLYRTDINVSVSPATLNSALFTTTGTYLAANISNLKLWYSTSSVFSTATSTLLSTKTTGLGSGAKSFSPLTQKIPLGTAYLFLTTDVPCATTLGNTIGVSAINTGNFGFATGTKSGSGFTVGGAQTLAALTLSTVSNQTICAGKSVQAINFVTSPAGSSLAWTNNNTSIGLASSGSGNISSYSAPALSSNQTGNISVTPSNGSCIGTPVAFNITVKNNHQSSSVWTGAVSNNWSDADNWSNCVCGSVTDVTISTSGSNPLINTTANIRNLNINSGSSLVLQNSQALNVYGDWTNNGIFIGNEGSVVLAGSSAQNIGGNSTTSFFDLVLNNSAGASLSTAQEIRGTLMLNSGVFNTNNKLTLTASATESGRIGPINSSADIINKVTVQQYAPGGSTGWALLGSPLSSALTMADWNDNFPITCLTCPNGYYNFPSIYSYNESIAGDYSSPNKYVPITSISNNITNGVGYWVYLGNGPTTTSAINFDVAGTVAKSNCSSCTGAVTIPLSFTSNNGTANDGWNLVSNPLPSPISWTALRNGNPNVDDAVYVYNADLNNGLGAHASYVNGVSSDIVGGITDNIAMCQGFYIHTNAATTLTAGEDIKTDSNPSFLRPAVKPVFRLLMDAIASKDMTTFYFEQGGTKHFQTAFDAYKLNFSSGPYIGSMSDSILTSISGLPELTANSSVLVSAITPATDSFTFSSLQQNFPNDVCVTLYDAYTGITTNIITNNYVCTLYDTTTVARFTIKFYTTTSSGISHVDQPVCGSPKGIISVTGSGNGPWNYEWTSNNSVVKTSLNKTTADSLDNLNGGTYSVKITSTGGCDHFSKTFVMNQVVVPTASFVPDVFTTSLSNSGKINFNNQSVGSQISSWDFGDNSGTMFVPSPSYNYISAGVYTVTLITESISHCKDTAQQVIEVINDVTGISVLNTNNSIKLATLSQGNYELHFSFDNSTNVEIRLFDLKGDLLSSAELKQVRKTHHSINLDGFIPGMYLVSVSTGDASEKTFKLIK